MNRKVRVGGLYIYKPVPLDLYSPPYGILNGTLQEGEVVRVVNKFGCPKANTMGHCYIENKLGLFLGLVCTNSLVPIKKEN